MGHISDHPLLMNVRFENYMVELHPDVSTFCLPDISYMTLLHMIVMKLSSAFPLHMTTDANTYWRR